MLAAAAVAFYRGFALRTGRTALEALGLGVLALGIAAWHLLRRPPGGAGHR